MENWSVLAWPVRWWGRQSLRARLTLITTAIFSIAVLTGVVLVLQLQRFALLRVLDSSAQKSANDIVTQLQARPNEFDDVVPTTGGVTRIQIVDQFDQVLGQHRSKLQQPLLNPDQLANARSGARIDITDPTNGLGVRVVAAKYGSDTVLVVTDVTRVDDSVSALERVAFVGGPLAVLLMGLATYLVCALTLKPVAELRHGAADISAAGLSEKRLPVPNARDEIHRLAVTLNAMLDRIASATSKQRTFVGDAAHELRSPLASLRVQLEVAQRIGPDESWQVLVDEVLEDVGRLERLVESLLTLARMDEVTEAPRRAEAVEIDALLQQVADRYEHARLPVTVGSVEPAVVTGDPDGLLRIVLNLTDNALRYANTEVTVALDVHPANGATAKSANAKSGTAKGDTTRGGLVRGGSARGGTAHRVGGDAAAPHATTTDGTQGASGQANGAASDGMKSNGTASNSTASNGTASNGTASNDTASNDTASNDTASNGTASNGTASNGTASNAVGSNGHGRNRNAPAGATPHGTVVISVTDDGPGIPAEERSRVFDRFYRLEQSRSRVSGGTGLGLAIAQDLAHSHGGEITLRDRADGAPGLVAEVSLPLSS